MNFYYNNQYFLVRELLPNFENIDNLWFWVNK